MVEARTTPEQPGTRREPRDFSLVGPLFYYDLVRVGRKRRTIVHRCVYAMLLLVGLRLAYGSVVPFSDVRSEVSLAPQAISARSLPRLARDFVIGILWVQTAVVFLVTPAYVGSAIGEEKERKTLDLLLTTHVHTRHIVLGKLAARASHVFLLLLAGLPLVALTQLWGGVDFVALVAAFVVTAINVLAVGSVCLFSSASASSTTQAVAASYVRTFYFGVVCFLFWTTPVSSFLFLNDRAHLTGGWKYLLPAGIMINSTAIVVGVCLSMRALRSDGTTTRSEKDLRNETTATPPVSANSEPQEKREVVPPGPRRIRPPLGNWPLIWKEIRFVDKRSHKGKVIGESIELVITIAAFALVAVVVFAGGAHDEELKGTSILEFILRFAFIVHALGWCAVALYCGADSISQEREKRTLDGILSLPYSRAQLLAAKWLGALLIGRVFGYRLAFISLVGLLSWSFHPLALLILICALAAHLAFMASFGVWCSVAARSTVQARVMATLVAAVLLGGGTIQLLAHSPRSVRAAGGTPPWRILVAETGANLPGTWRFLTGTDFRARTDTRDSLLGPRFAVAGCGIAAYTATAGFLWLLGYRHFCRAPSA
jgi:ABC-type Na+ efflux pump permease subunit